MELDDVLLQLFADFCLLLEQVLPGLEDLAAPLHEQLISGLELVDQHDLILEEVVVIGDLLVELGLALPGGLGLFAQRLHLLALVLGGVAVHVVDGPEGGQQDLLDPVGQHLQVLHLPVVQLRQLQGHPLEGLVDEVLLGLLGEVELGDGLVEGAVEGEGVLEVLDEVLDEAFGVLDLLPVERLEGQQDAGALLLADPSSLHVLFELVEVELLAFGEGDVEELRFLGLRVADGAALLEDLLLDLGFHLNSDNGWTSDHASFFFLLRRFSDSFTSLTSSRSFFYSFCLMSSMLTTGLAALLVSAAVMASSLVCFSSTKTAPSNLTVLVCCPSPVSPKVRRMYLEYMSWVVKSW